MSVTDKPIDKSLFIGRSETFSLDEALRDALTQAAGGGADIQVDFQIQRIFGQVGGITGKQDLCVEIRVDSEVGQDVPASGQPQAPMATRLQLMEQAVRELEIAGLRSYPPQFVLRGKLDMPTPGFTFHVDSTKVEPRAGRIVVRLTEVPPSDAGPTSATDPAVLSVQLGTLRTGRYVVEIYSRRSPSERHQLLQAVALEAS